MAIKIVTLNVLVDEVHAEELANHLSRTTRLSDVCGVADFARRNNIDIHDYGTHVEDPPKGLAGRLHNGKLLPMGYRRPAERLEKDQPLHLFGWNDVREHWLYYSAFPGKAGDTPLEAYARELGFTNEDGSINPLYDSMIILEQEM